MAKFYLSIISTWSPKCTLSKFADNTKLCVVFSIWGGRDVGLCDHHEGQQGEGWGFVHGSGQSQAQVLAGQRMDREQPWEERPGPLEGQQDKHEHLQSRKTVIFWAALKRNVASGLNKRSEISSIALSWDPAWTTEFSSGVPNIKGCGENPDEGQNYVRQLEHVSCADWDSGALQPREERIPAKSYSNVPVPKGALKEC